MTQIPSTRATREIELFFDVGSSYSYLALARVEEIEKRTHTPVRVRPFLLGGVFKATGNDMPARIAAKAKYLVADMNRWAKEYGVAWTLPPIFPISTVTTQRALVVAERLGGQSDVRTFARGLFHAYWAEGKDVSHRSVIEEVANAVALDGAAIAGGIDAPETKDRLRADTEEAVERGAFGAPTFFFEGEMFFGNDRIPHLERRVLSTLPEHPVS